MSRKDLSFEDVLLRINNNFNNVKPKGEVMQTSSDYSQLQLQLTTELEQVNRKWGVSPDFVITSHRGNIGKFIVFGKKVIRKMLRWYIAPAFQKQREYNASVTKTLNIMKEQANYKNNVIDNLIKEDHQLSNKINTISLQLEQLVQDKEHLIAENNRLIKVVDQLLETQDIKTKDVLDKINSSEKNIEDNFSLVFNHVEALKEQLVIEHNQQQQINEKLDITEELLGFVRRKLKKIETGIPTSYNEFKEEQQQMDIEVKRDLQDYQIDYLLFENKFRGSRKTIKERQKQYLQYISQTDKILDIGCGRGEFIELLMDNGISAEGIDLNKDMVEYCIERGFNVKYADAIQYLSMVPPQSYDCITMCQVIEHLSFEQYAYLLTLIHNALKPGGKVIIETINAQSVYAMSNWFYIDPTHTKPVHPETLDFVIKEIGFHKTERKYLSPVDHVNIPQINAEDSEQFNKAIGDLYGMIYGNQDYAIIAWR
ncbi:class I SAM-dependent methyltransferase [Paenibacillus sp. NPDC101420]|uniref:class I SAM-dependent methyltransferase n=1 Tax=Paenibacillus sp. NPDC101420 TaxID=3390602 RepID=UPI003D0181BC